MGSKPLVARAVNDPRTKRDELEQVFIPLHAFDREFDADDAIRAHRGGLGTHAGQGQFTRVVHGLRKYVEFLILVPAAVLDADVIDAGANA